MINIIGKRKIFYIFSAALIFASIFGLLKFGLNLGIDFKGGSLLEVEYQIKRPSEEDIRKSLGSLNLEDLTVQSVGEKGVILRMKDIDEETHQKILTILEFLPRFTSPKSDFKSEAPDFLPQELENKGVKIEGENVEGLKIEEFKPAAPEKEEVIKEKRFESIGPSIGRELKNRAIVGIVLVLLGISIYITFAFRKSSKPVSSWKYGITTIITLFHDVLISAGFFSFWGKFTGAEIDSNFIVALLVVMGFSVHDTIVVFDRTRENLKKRSASESFEAVVNRSVNETITRSINTTFTVISVLLALMFFGAPVLLNFIIVLIIGVAIGIYSSIFIASPILVDWEKRGKR